MKILILGGTVFLGRALVDAAGSQHTLTLFNRGKSNPGLFPEIEQVHGSRETDLALLDGRTWDVVIDTCGYLPRIVRLSAEKLAGAVGRYVFISSLSVYADTSQVGIDENAPVGQIADPTVEEITGETYGPLKVLCEQAVQAALPDRCLIIRPGLIVGPHDPSDRFTYWPWRVAAGGEVLAPGRPERGVQFIDVRDLAEWTLSVTVEGRTGVFNAEGPAQPVAMRSFLEACQAAAGSDASFTWVDDAFLAENQVQPWTEMPLYVPESDPDAAGFFAFDSQKAIRAGLTFRPLPDTIQATLAWLPSRPAGKPWRAGLTPERERQLLAAWHARQA